MSDMSTKKISRSDSAYAGQVGVKAARMLKARKNPSPGVWFGLGMMGTVGWSVAVPTLLGTALGVWLDKRHPGTHAWTPALLSAGLMLGFYNAWRWVAKEDEALHREAEVDEDE